MTKKRQQDFQKTKLRVGRPLPRGRNITNTSFQSDKIIIRQDIPVSKPKSSERSAEEFLKNLNHSNPAGLVKTLNRYNAHLLENKNAVIAELPRVIHRLMDFIQDSDHNVRISAINTIQSILSFTSDVQISCFFLLLTKSLSCMMTHSNFEVRQDSLQLFDAILSTHSGLMWQHKIFLDHLLGLISHVDSSQPMDTRKRRKTLEDSFTEDLKAQDWRIQVLGHMNNFLIIILKNLIKNESSTEDEQEVYWDGKQPLFVPIYTGGGLKPIDIEAFGHWNNASSHIYYSPEVAKSFASDLLPLLSGAYTEEVPQILLSSTKETLVSQNTLENLGIIFQILYHMGKWIKTVSNSHNELDIWFASVYHSNISSKLMRRFPFSLKIERETVGRGRRKKVNQPSGIQLNLNICFLYSTFILGTSHSTITVEKRVLLYLESVFAINYEECFCCLPLLVEISKSYLSFSDNEGIKSSFLKGMCGKLNCRDSRPQQKQLQNFFIELTLNPEFKDLSETPAMKLWFSLLLTQLSQMMKTGDIDKKFLKDVRKICSRQYPDFIECLQNIKPEEFLKLLNFENEDFQETIIHLLYHTKDLSPDFLQDIAEAILLNHSFSLRTASRLIRLLAHRFSRSDVKSIDQIYYLKFLLNVACDTVSMAENQYCNEEVAQYMIDKWKMLVNVSTYEILPTIFWERHSVLHEVCLESLRLFPEPQKSICTGKFMQCLLEDPYRIPVHSAIALFKLKNDFSTSKYLSQDKEINGLMYELAFSSLLYTSLLSSYVTDWEKYSIPDMQSLLVLNRQNIPEILVRMEGGMSILDVNSAYHFLRIFGFLITKKIVIPNDKQDVMPLLESLEVFRNDSAEYNELFLDVCRYFNYYSRRP